MSSFHDEAASSESGEPFLPRRNLIQAMICGGRGRCPSCGDGRLFPRYLKVGDGCPACGEALYHHRADDAPPYFTILIAGHLIVPPLLAFETAFKPALWIHAAVWLPLATLLCLALLPPVKGTIVGLQWGLYMHGFDPGAVEEAEPARAETLG